jgi:hypothetical protein
MPIPKKCQKIIEWLLALIFKFIGRFFKEYFGIPSVVFDAYSKTSRKKYFHVNKPKILARK